MGTKNTTISLRTADHEKDFLTYAASLSHEGMSEYVLRNALKQAEIDIATRSVFKIPASKVEEFYALLDRSVQENEGLKRLMTEETVLD